MTDIKMNLKNVVYDQKVKQISDEEQKKKQEQEQLEVEEQEVVEPGSVGVNDREGSLFALEQKGMLASIGQNVSAGAKTDETITEYEISGMKFSVGQSDASAGFTYKVEDNRIIFTAYKCTININEVTNDKFEIEIYGSEVTLNANAKVAYITNNANKSIINGSDENDIIIDKSSKSTINGGAGDDIISSFGLTTTIHGDAGNDTITSTGAFSKVYGDDGKDNITATGANVTVDLGDQKDTAYVEGKDITVKTDKGNSIVDGQGKNITVESDPDSTNKITLDGPDNKVEGGSDKDHIEINGDVKQDGDISVETFDLNGEVDGKIYVNGELLTGLYPKNNKMYKDGELLTGVSVTDNRLYKGGVLDTEEKVFEGKLYSGGMLARGTREIGDIIYINGIPQKKYDEEGYDKDGYDREGYNREGYNREGYDREGYKLNEDGSKTKHIYDGGKIVGDKTINTDGSSVILGYDDKGNTISKKMYNTRGQITLFEEYKDGKTVSTTTYRKDGTVSSYTKINEDNTSYVLLYDNNGRHVLTRTDYTGDIIRKTTNYTNDKITSITLYDDKGQFQIKTVYSDDGSAKSYDVENKLINGTVNEVTYKNGEVDVDALFDTLVSKGYIDKDGKILTEQSYILDFLKSKNMIDEDGEYLDSNTVSSLLKRLDTEPVHPDGFDKEGNLWIGGKLHTGPYTGEDKIEKLYKEGKLDTKDQVYPGNGKLYIGGSLSTGTKAFGNSLFINGLKDSTEFRAFDGKLYNKGDLATGIAEKAIDNQLFLKGIKATDENHEFEGRIYQHGDLDTADETEWNKHLYKKGVMVTDDFAVSTSGKLYEKGSLSTKEICEYGGLTYSYGSPADGVIGDCTYEKGILIRKTTKNPDSSTKIENYTDGKVTAERVYDSSNNLSSMKFYDRDEAGNVTKTTEQSNFSYDGSKVTGFKESVSITSPASKTEAEISVIDRYVEESTNKVLYNRTVGTNVLAYTAAEATVPPMTADSFGKIFGDGSLATGQIGTKFYEAGIIIAEIEETADGSKITNYTGGKPSLERMYDKEKNLTSLKLYKYDDDELVEQKTLVYNKEGKLESFTEEVSPIGGGDKVTSTITIIERFKDGETDKVAYTKTTGAETLTYYANEPVIPAITEGSAVQIFADGVLATGVVNTKLYKNGVLDTETQLYPAKDGKLYVNGELSKGKAEFEGFVYYNGSLAQLTDGDIDGDGLLYVNGIKQENKPESEFHPDGKDEDGKMWQDNKLLTGKSRIDEQYYYEGDLANEVIVEGKMCVAGKIADEVVVKDLMYKDGVPANCIIDGKEYVNGIAVPDVPVEKSEIDEVKALAAKISPELASEISLADTTFIDIKWDDKKITEFTVKTPYGNKTFLIDYYPTGPVVKYSEEVLPDGTKIKTATGYYATGNMSFKEVTTWYADGSYSSIRDEYNQDGSVKDKSEVFKDKDGNYTWKDYAMGDKGELYLNRVEYRGSDKNGDDCSKVEHFREDGTKESKSCTTWYKDSSYYSVNEKYTIDGSIKEKSEVAKDPDGNYLWTDYALNEKNELYINRKETKVTDGEGHDIDLVEYMDANGNLSSKSVTTWFSNGSYYTVSENYNPDGSVRTKSETEKDVSGHYKYIDYKLDSNNELYISRKEGSKTDEAGTTVNTIEYYYTDGTVQERRTTTILVNGSKTENGAKFAKGEQPATISDADSRGITCENSYSKIEFHEDGIIKNFTVISDTREVFAPINYYDDDGLTKRYRTVNEDGSVTEVTERRRADGTLERKNIHTTNSDGSYYDLTEDYSKDGIITDKAEVIKDAYNNYTWVDYTLDVDNKLYKNREEYRGDDKDGNLTSKVSHFYDDGVTPSTLSQTTWYKDSSYYSVNEKYTENGLVKDKSEVAKDPDGNYIWTDFTLNAQNELYINRKETKVTDYEGNSINLVEHIDESGNLTSKSVTTWFSNDTYYTVSESYKDDGITPKSRSEVQKDIDGCFSYVDYALDSDDTLYVDRKEYHVLDEAGTTTVTIEYPFNDDTIKRRVIEKRYVNGTRETVSDEAFTLEDAEPSIIAPLESRGITCANTFSNVEYHEDGVMKNFTVTSDKRVVFAPINYYDGPGTTLEYDKDGWHVTERQRADGTTQSISKRKYGADSSYEYQYFNYNKNGDVIDKSTTSRDAAGNYTWKDWELDEENNLYMNREEYRGTGTDTKGIYCDMDRVIHYYPNGQESNTNIIYWYSDGAYYSISEEFTKNGFKSDKAEVIKDADGNYTWIDYTLSEDNKLYRNREEYRGIDEDGDTTNKVEHFFDDGVTPSSLSQTTWYKDSSYYSVNEKYDREGNVLSKGEVTKDGDGNYLWVDYALDKDGNLYIYRTEADVDFDDGRHINTIIYYYPGGVKEKSKHIDITYLDGTKESTTEYYNEDGTVKVGSQTHYTRSASGNEQVWEYWEVGEDGKLYLDHKEVWLKAEDESGTITRTYTYYLQDGKTPKSITTRTTYANGSRDDLYETYVDGKLSKTTKYQSDVYGNYLYVYSKYDETGKQYVTEREIVIKKDDEGNRVSTTEKYYDSGYTKSWAQTITQPNGTNNREYHEYEDGKMAASISDDIFLNGFHKDEDGVERHYTGGALTTGKVGEYMYKNGVKANGDVADCLYREGVLDTEDQIYTDPEKGTTKLYLNGRVPKGIATFDVEEEGGTKVTKTFLNGILLTGRNPENDQMYEKGIVLTGVSSVDQKLYKEGYIDMEKKEFEGRLFENGRLQTKTQEFEGKLYIRGYWAKDEAEFIFIDHDDEDKCKLYLHGVLATDHDYYECRNKLFLKGVLSSNPEDEYNEHLYREGSKVNGKAISSTNKLYTNGDLDRTKQAFDGKLFNNGELDTVKQDFNGKLYTDGVLDTTKQDFGGKLYTDGSLDTVKQDFNGTLYTFGEVDRTKQEFKGKLYTNGSIDRTEQIFDDKLFTDGSLNTTKQEYGPDHKLFTDGYWDRSTQAFNEKLYIGGYWASGEKEYDLDGKLYLNGVFASGTAEYEMDYKYFKNGILATGDVYSTGGKRYIDGYLMETVDGVVYHGGQPFTGTLDGVEYLNGVLASSGETDPPAATDASAADATASRDILKIMQYAPDGADLSQYNIYSVEKKDGKITAFTVKSPVVAPMQDADVCRVMLTYEDGKLASSKETYYDDMMSMYGISSYTSLYFGTPSITKYYDADNKIIKEERTNDEYYVDGYSYGSIYSTVQEFFDYNGAKISRDRINSNTSSSVTRIDDNRSSSVDLSGTIENDYELTDRDYSNTVSASGSSSTYNREYKTDSSSRIIQSLSNNGTSSSIYDAKYNDDGTIKEYSSVSNSGYYQKHVFTYNADKLATHEDILSTTPSGSELYSVDTEYNADKLPSKQTQTDSYGNKVIVEYKYNADKMYSEIKTTDENGVVTIQNFEYNSDKMVSRKTETIDGEITTVDYEYNTAKMMTKITATDSEGRKTIINRDFNDKGLLIKESQTQEYILNGGSVPVTESVYTKEYSYNSKSMLVYEKIVTDYEEREINYQRYSNGNFKEISEVIINSSSATTTTSKFSEDGFLQDVKVTTLGLSEYSSGEDSIIDRTYTYKDGYIKTKTQNGITYTYDYYSNGHVKQVTWTDALGVDNKVEYTDKGKIDKKTKGDVVSTYKYDTANDRLLEITSTDGSSQKYEYNTAGEIAKYTSTNKDGEATTTTYSYDSLNRIIKKECTDGTSATYEYQTNGLIGKTSTVSSTYGYVFDEKGERSYAKLLVTTDNIYDAHGKLTSSTVTREDGKLSSKEEYTYHTNGTIKTQVTTSVSYSYTPEKTTVTTTEYNIQGNKTKESEDFGGSVELHEWQYAADGKTLLKEIQNIGGNELVLYECTYAVDGKTKVQEITRKEGYYNDSLTITTKNYDAKGREKDATVTDKDGNITGTYSYKYYTDDTLQEEVYTAISSTTDYSTEPPTPKDIHYTTTRNYNTSGQLISAVATSDYYGTVEPYKSVEYTYFDNGRSETTTEKFYNSSTGELTDYTVTECNSDGTTKSIITKDAEDNITESIIYTYHENGKTATEVHFEVTSEYDYEKGVMVDVKLTTTTTYNKLGQMLTSITKDETDEIIESEEYTYTSAGLKVHYNHYRKQTKTSFDYEKYEYITTVKEYTTDREYNAKGRPILERTVDETGKVTETITWDYYDNGRIARQETKVTDGNTTLESYNSKGNRTLYRVTDKDGNISEENVVEYWPDLSTKKKEVDFDSYYGTTTTTYNDKGYELEEINTDKSGNVKYSRNYTYAEDDKTKTQEIYFKSADYSPETRTAQTTTTEYIATGLYSSVQVLTSVTKDTDGNVVKSTKNTYWEGTTTLKEKVEYNINETRTYDYETRTYIWTADPTTTTTTYDEKGKTISIVVTDNDGNVREYIEYYPDSTNKKEHIKVLSSGNTQTIEYNENGKVLSDVITDSKDNIVESTYNKYYENGNIQESDHTVAGVSQQIISYNENGKPESDITYDSEGAISKSVYTTYHENGKKQSEDKFDVNYAFREYDEDRQTTVTVYKPYSETINYDTLERETSRLGKNADDETILDNRYTYVGETTTKLTEYTYKTEIVRGEYDSATRAYPAVKQTTETTKNNFTSGKISSKTVNVFKNDQKTTSTETEYYETERSYYDMKKHEKTTTFDTAGTIRQTQEISYYTPTEDAYSDKKEREEIIVNDSTGAVIKTETTEYYNSDSYYNIKTHTIDDKNHEFREYDEEKQQWVNVNKHYTLNEARNEDNVVTYKVETKDDRKIHEEIRTLWDGTNVLKSETIYNIEFTYEYKDGSYHAVEVITTTTRNYNSDGKLLDETVRDDKDTVISSRVQTYHSNGVMATQVINAENGTKTEKSWNEQNKSTLDKYTYADGSFYSYVREYQTDGITPKSLVYTTTSGSTETTTYNIKGNKLSQVDKNSSGITIGEETWTYWDDNETLKSYERRDASCVRETIDYNTQGKETSRISYNSDHVKTDEVITTYREDNTTPLQKVETEYNYSGSHDYITTTNYNADGMRTDKKTRNESGERVDYRSDEYWTYHPGTTTVKTHKTDDYDGDVTFYAYYSNGYSYERRASYSAYYDSWTIHYYYETGDEDYTRKVENLKGKDSYDPDTDTYK